MSVGPRMNIRLALEAPVRVEDGIGGHSLVWETLGTLWGEMRAAAGRESRGEVGAVSTVAWAITVRGAPAGDRRRPAAGQRLRLGARLFRIEAVAERGPAGRHLTCFATEEGAP
jgi:head-tail adaptor